MTFRVGQKVVCIKPMSEWTKDAHALGGFPFRPALNAVYTIRAVRLVFGHPYLYLQEIHNPQNNWSEIGFAEPPFWAGMFRPIVERKTDISIFKKMLIPSRRKEAVR